MKLLSTHESFLSTFNYVIISFTDHIGQDKDVYNFNNNMNKPLFYIKPNGSMGMVIPDFQAVIENSNHTPGDPFIPKWIGEVAFTVLSFDTHANLKQIVESQPMVNLEFMLTIQESSKWMSPPSKDIVKNFCTELLLSFKNFVLPIAENSLGPVVVDQFTWISIT